MFEVHPSVQIRPAVSAEVLMTPEEVVRAELDAWSRLDVDEILSHFADDAVWDNVPFGPVTGHDAIRKAVTGYLARTTSGNIENLNEWGGKMIHARVMGAFEVAGDKIAAWRDYFDSHGH